MQPVQTRRPEWGLEEAGELRTFLGTSAGRRFSFALLSSAPRPVVVPGSSAEFALGAVAGYEQMVGVINALAAVPDGVQAGATGTEMYPDLEDNSKWGDGAGV